MKTKQEIKDKIKEYENEQKKAFCKCEYALWDELDTKIDTLKWVLGVNKEDV